MAGDIISSNRQSTVESNIKNIAHTEEWIKTTCPYCGVGCGVEVKQVEEQNQAEPKFIIRGDNSHPANFGKLCSKGLALAETITTNNKLLTPSINNEPTTWDNALDHVADKFSQTIKKYGPDSVAFYVSGQLLTEDYYVANKLIKGFIGTANIDTNSRLCMSSSVAGHKRAFGSDTVPNCYEDFEKAELVVLIGSNLAWCHPVLYQRLKTAKENNPELRVVVIDPRKTDTCDIADLHLAIKAGSDVSLFSGLLSYLSNFNYLDEYYINSYVNNFAATLACAQTDTNTEYNDRFNFLTIANATGLTINQIENFYEWFATTDKTLSVFSQGVNQSSSGTDKVNSIINCHLATGRIGREGSGPFSITGQPNAMGGREVGGLANMLAAHMDFPIKGKPESNAGWQTVSDFWQTKNLAKKPGLKAVDLFDAVYSGKIKAIWIMATNPVVSMPNSNKIKAALKKCPLVIVSDCITKTDTTAYADVLLPAMGWAEKSGTVTNSERRISRQRSVFASNTLDNIIASDTLNASLTENQARPDWWIMSHVAQRMGFAGFEFANSADIFREHATLSGMNNTDANNNRRDFDISALATITNEEYDKLTPQQWPLTNGSDTQSSKRFFSAGNFYTQNKKANMIAVTHKNPTHQTTQAYPLILNSGRIRDQWHTMTRTGIVAKLGAHITEPFVHIHPVDAEFLKLKDQSIAAISNQWGETKARISVTKNVTPGNCFMPIHWSKTNASDGHVCNLVSPDVDPVSGQPELKHTPVKIEVWQAQSNALVISKDPLNENLLDEYFGYWVKRTVDSGFHYTLASTKDSHEIASQLKQNALAIMGIQIEFNHKESSSYRSAKIVDKQLLSAFVVAPQIKHSDYAWLDTLLAKELDTDIQRSLLSGKACASLLEGKQICACKQVGELTIKQSVRESLQAQKSNNHVFNAEETLENVRTCTNAGTGCGSCVPEIKQIIAKITPSVIDEAI